MRILIASLAPLFLLAACGPVTLYHKEGGSVSRLNTDLLSCKVDALDKAPVANQIRQFPPYYVPGRRYCRSEGDCYTRGGFFAPGEIYSVDINARLRNDLENQCMSRLGYQPVAVPRCAANAIPEVSQNTSSTGQSLPTLSQKSCAVRDSQGEWQIINPKG